MPEGASQGNSIFRIRITSKCVFSDEKKLCERCSSRRLECHKVYGKQRQFAKLLQVVVSSSNEIARSPSAPNYVELTPGEQQGVQYLYRMPRKDIFLIEILEFLKFRSGIYIDEAGLRYALLARSAIESGKLSTERKLSFQVSVCYEGH